MNKFEIPVNDYVRTIDGYIAKCIKIDDEAKIYIFDKPIQYSNNYQLCFLRFNEQDKVKKNSCDLLDLIEVSDIIEFTANKFETVDKINLELEYEDYDREEGYTTIYNGIHTKEGTTVYFDTDLISISTRQAPYICYKLKNLPKHMKKDSFTDLVTLNDSKSEHYVYQRYKGEIRKYRFFNNTLINTQNENDIIDLNLFSLLGKTSENLKDLIEVGDYVNDRQVKLVDGYDEEGNEGKILAIEIENGDTVENYNPLMGNYNPIKNVEIKEVLIKEIYDRYCFKED